MTRLSSPNKLPGNLGSSPFDIFLNRLPKASLGYSGNIIPDLYKPNWYSVPGIKGIYLNG